MENKKLFSSELISSETIGAERRPTFGLNGKALLKNSVNLKIAPNPATRKCNKFFQIKYLLHSSGR
jgi:hypothetical protein